MTLGEKIDVLVAHKNKLNFKEVKIDPYKDLELLEALNGVLDTAIILMKLIEQKGKQSK